MTFAKRFFCFEGGCGVNAFNPSSLRLREADVCVFDDNLFYRVSSTLARAT